MEIRNFAWPDYDAVCALWQRLGMWKAAIDNPEALAECVAANPGLFVVAVDPAASDRIVGTTIGTFDGRRGYLYHVAVDPDYRRQGLGEALLQEVLTRLWARGAAKITLRVARENHGAIAFYQSQGLNMDEHVVGMSIERET